MVDNRKSVDPSDEIFDLIHTIRNKQKAKTLTE